MGSVIFGVIVPAVVFIFSFVMTEALYRYFTRGRGE